jgi:hydroxymethylbilane synthase
MREKIILGTRGSELAQLQTGMVTDRLQKRWADLEVEIKIIRTGGDESSAKESIPNLRAGRKGLFTAEIERALLAREIDLAVHSAKDLPSEMSQELEVAAVLPRGPIHDVLVSAVPQDLQSLPRGGTIATGSVRREHQLHWTRPDLNVVDLRGNVPTRLRKLSEAGWHAIVLAQAGLERLGLSLTRDQIRYEGKDFFTATLPQEIFLPAGGQGVIALQIRNDDNRARMFVEQVNDSRTGLCLRAEREFLRLLQADCDQPVGVLATTDGTRLKIYAQVFVKETAAPKEGTVEGATEDGERLAAELFKAINGT